MVSVVVILRVVSVAVIVCVVSVAVIVSGVCVALIISFNVTCNMKYVDMKLVSLFEACQSINAVTYCSMLCHTVSCITVVCSSEVAAYILFKYCGLLTVYWTVYSILKRAQCLMWLIKLTWLNIQNSSFTKQSE